MRHSEWVGQDGAGVHGGGHVAAHRGLGHQQLDDVRDDGLGAAGGRGSVATEVLQQRHLQRGFCRESV